MPPWSDIRSHALALAAQGQYITFLDVLPMVRLAQTMVHLPDSTLAALTALHDGPGTTDGARALLTQLTRGYWARTHRQRALARKVITPSHQGRDIRVKVGDGFVVALPTPKNYAWHWSLVEGSPDAAPVSIEPATSRQAGSQRFAVHALAAGTATLQAKQVAQTPATKAPMALFRFRVLVDPETP